MDILLSTGENAASALTAMAVNALGGRAISLTGAQAGILTDRVHTKAKIANITPRQIHELLADDYIVIVAGFQGQNAEGETTTLGRGGSDLTAIALAGALEADACQIFTDVDGVFTCDPRVVAEAKKIRSLTTNCSRWRAPARKSCNRAPSSLQKNSAFLLKYDPVSRSAGNDCERRNAEHGRRRCARRQRRS